MHKYKQRFVSCIFIIIFLFLMLARLGTTKEVVKEALTSTVRFDANYGISPVHEKNVKVGSRYGSLPYPERTGYKFLGWYQKKM